MSLSEAVLEIVGEMEETESATSMERIYHILSEKVRSWAKQLRRAVKAAEGSVPAKNEMMESLKALAQDREERLKKQAQEDVSAANTSMVLVAEGPSKDLFVVVDPQMPVGAKMFVEGRVHELKADRKLYPVEDKA